MMNLLQQLERASKHARALADEAGARKMKRKQDTAQRFESRAAGGNTKHLPTGLKQALLERLPVGEENAITQAEVRPLISDIQYAESGLSATLSNLAKSGEAYRTESRPYRYYK